MTVETLLKWGANFLQTLNTPRLEAELLLGHLLAVDRATLYVRSKDKMDDATCERYRQLCDRRLKGEPMAYLLGHQEFWSLEIEVNPYTLIPRPETELLVELALKKLMDATKIRLLELGVGSGAVIIAIGRERPTWELYGTDICPQAIETASRNAMKFHRQITFILSDWWENIPKQPLFDVILSNPPYITPNDPHLEALSFEPLRALVAEKEGLGALEKIIANAPQYLKKGGLILLEHAYNQADSVRHLLKAASFVEVESYQDLSGIERVSAGIYKGKK